MKAALGLGIAALLVCGPLAQAHAATSQDNPPDYQTEPLVPPDMADIARQAAGLFNARRYDEAAKAYLFIIDRHPKSLHAWSNLGVTWFISQKYDQAADAFEKAIELAPNYPVAHEMLSITYYQRRDFPAAENAARRALAIDAANIGAIRSLAMALAAQNRLDEARTSIARGLELEPDNPDLLKLRDILQEPAAPAPPAKP